MGEWPKLCGAGGGCIEVGESFELEGGGGTKVGSKSTNFLPNHDKHIVIKKEIYHTYIHKWAFKNQDSNIPDCMAKNCC